ncbi:uncharacterized protein LJ206_005390 [Theristicus caerulescens]
MPTHLPQGHPDHRALTSALLAGPFLMTTSAAPRFLLCSCLRRGYPPTFPSGAAPGAGAPRTAALLGAGGAAAPGDAAEAAWAPRVAAPRGSAQRRGGGIAPRPPEAAASARPRRPPPCPPVSAGRPHGSGAPLAAGPAGHGGECGVSLQWLLWYRGAAPAGAAAAPHAASVHPSIHPSLRGRRLVCVCVTDSAARTARGQPPSRSQPGATPARPGCGSPFSVPRSPPRRGRPQRPRCSSSSSLLAEQVIPTSPSWHIFQ